MPARVLPFRWQPFYLARLRREPKFYCANCGRLTHLDEQTQVWVKELGARPLRVCTRCLEEHRGTYLLTAPALGS